MKTFLSVFILFCAAFSSCTDNSDSGVVTFKLAKGDLLDKLDVRGTVQAVVNIPVVPPGGYFGQTTVLKLSADGQYVSKGDTICVLSNREIEAMNKDALVRIDSLEAALKKAEADNNLKEALLIAQLSTSEAQLKISSLDSLKMAYATPVDRKLLELQIKKSGIEKDKAEKKLKATRAIGVQEINQIKARITEARAKSATLADQVRALVITARRDGIVMRTESPRMYFMGSQGSGVTGGSIREGSVLLMDNPVLQFPDLSQMQVSAEVAEPDFKRIESAQKVRIRVDMKKPVETTGKVNRKNLIGRRDYWDEEQSKVNFYEVIIDIDSCHVLLKPGLSALCEIILADVRDTVFVPSMAIFKEDSSKVVYVMQNKKFWPVKVVTGLSGGSFTVIEKGLSGDEIIALSIPPDKLIIADAKGKEKQDTTRKHDPV
jgi:HlyD family secretion protein